MKIPIVSGIYTDQNANFRVQYPINIYPVAVNSGISEAYLKPAHGIRTLVDSVAIDQGGIVRNGVMYRLIGGRLYIVSHGNLSLLADTGCASGYARFDYSFSKLAIAVEGKLFYWDTVLTQVTDADLGLVKDMLWVDGYFMTTDGENLVVTELNDPTSIDPLKYGSSEVDPDPVQCLLKLRNEVYALNRYTIEVFQNVGTEFFPFQRVPGALLQKGTIGTRTAAIFMDSVAFVGSGRSENIGVYMGNGGNAARISTREIDLIIGEYTELQLTGILVESIILDGDSLLYIHLPNITLVYNGTTSLALKTQVWYLLSSSNTGDTRYNGRNLLFNDGEWVCGHPTANHLGVLDSKLNTHYGNNVCWIFSTPILYNENKGVIIHALELLANTGATKLGITPVIFTSYSLDGIKWSQESMVITGKFGEANKRLCWRRCGKMRNRRIQRFRGYGITTIATLDATLEPLYV